LIVGQTKAGACNATRRREKRIGNFFCRNVFSAHFVNKIRQSFLLSFSPVLQRMLERANDNIISASLIEPHFHIIIIAGE
jgi:hypothetical protein